MRTWSAEEVFIRVYACVAVKVQQVIDVLTTLERITRPPKGKRSSHDIYTPKNEISDRFEPR